MIARLLGSVVVVWLLLVVGFALAGCATPGGGVVYQPVKTVVAVSCVPASLGPAPVVDKPSDLAKLDGPERYAKLAADYLALLARSLETEPVIAACR